MEGSIVSTRKGFINHVGILASDQFGTPTVISNSGKFGKVVEESLSSFSDGKPIHYEGYPGNRMSYEVTNTARSLLNSPYDLFQNNCEHFVRKAHGLKEESPQLVAYSILVLITALVLMLLKYKY